MKSLAITKETSDNQRNAVQEERRLGVITTVRQEQRTPQSCSTTIRLQAYRIGSMET